MAWESPDGEGAEPSTTWFLQQIHWEEESETDGERRDLERPEGQPDRL